MQNQQCMINIACGGHRNVHIHGGDPMAARSLQRLHKRAVTSKLVHTSWEFD